ncbi:MAG TPA: CinA family protein [Candidatus Binataceae bacterium]|nr:CinA family protein [Candidatus Binataceae bacterium]
MRELIAAAEKIGAILKERKQTVAVGESSAGGLISAALLAVAGASAYFTGGAVVYTRESRRELLGLPDSAFAGIKSVTEDLALILARGAKNRLSATWGVSEIGAAGPTGTRYGNPPGFSCIAVAGPIERALTLETKISDRYENMIKFSAAALELLAGCLEAARS